MSELMGAIQGKHGDRMSAYMIHKSNHMPAKLSRYRLGSSAILSALKLITDRLVIVLAGICHRLAAEFLVIRQTRLRFFVFFKTGL